MTTEILIERIKNKARQDKRNRQDHRYLEALGFMVAKGFLKTNQVIPPAAQERIRIEDAVWAGRVVEPRILEVLPAALLHFPECFDFDPAKHRKLAKVIRSLRRGDETGEDFYGAPYKKIKVWATH